MFRFELHTKNDFYHFNIWKGNGKYLIFRNFIQYIHNCTVMLNSCHDIKIKFGTDHISRKLNCFFLNDKPAASVKIQICLYALQKKHTLFKVYDDAGYTIYILYGMYKYMYWNLTEFCIIFWTYISLLIYINTIDVNFVFCI